MDKIQAIISFWSQFGWPAYDETTVPDSAQLPYITYNVSEDDFDHPVAQTISLWDRSTSWMSTESKKKEIKHAIGRGGVMKTYDDGAVWIRRGVPFAQRLSDPDDMIRRIILNIELEFIDQD